MTRLSRLTHARNSPRTFIGALFIVGIGYALAFFVSDVSYIPSFADAVSYQGSERREALRPFVAAVASTGSDAARTQNDSIRVIAVGDIMLDRGVKFIVGKAGDGDPYFPFAHIRNIISSADIAFGNLEGPVSDMGNNVGSIYSFRMPIENVRVLEDVGFDVFSFANNHVGDWNIDAFTDTLRRFTGSRVGLTGAGMTADAAERPVVRDIGGTRIGFIGFSDVGPNWLKATSERPGINIASEEDIDRIVRQASAQVDILLVSFHFGEEYQTTANARQRALAYVAVDAGADAVIGHHPHVGQEVEEYRGALIAYSLGNFVFDQRFSEDTSKGLLLELTIIDRQIKAYTINELNFNAYFQPLPTWDTSTMTTSNN